MQNAKQLDFVIIGAQKSGTTSLFYHLKDHPQIYMPAEKELAFFSDDERYQRGWDWLLAEVFGDAPQDALWGEASPQYMGYPGVPERIARHVPHCRCVAILRDPVERAYSHYRMGARRGYERRSFEECIRAQLVAGALRSARAHPTPVNSYVIWGEYGRVLSEYADHLPREQMLVLFTRDLAADPRAVMADLYAFLGVRQVFPDNLGQRFREGGGKARSSLVASVVSAVPAKAIRRIVPVWAWRQLGRLNYLYEQWNTAGNPPDRIPLDPALLDELQAHYQQDSALLEPLTASRLPWMT
jgi:hypothetical protein